MRNISVLAAAGSPADIGTVHGAAFPDEIGAYLADRTELSRTGTDLSSADVISIAERMLAAHRTYDEALYIEMVAMAEAAGITPAQAVIVGGYTDFIDTVRAVARGTAMEDTCTAVITPNETSEGKGFLAQTWDMHASATPHVFIFDVAPTDAPRALVFTTHGALGQIGMNEVGIAVGINNLTMSDGSFGVTWPTVVRKALRQTKFEDALACITDAKLAGGHNFLLFDADGNGASIEATPTATHVDRLEDRPLVHTNHCLSPTTQRVEEERPADLEENSIRRLKDATSMVDAATTHTTESLMTMLRDETSICRHPEPPYSYESSGAVIMRPRTRELWACWGVPSENEFEAFSLA
jgi:isopenicillin-N N-acyltransferase-like protein